LVHHKIASAVKRVEFVSDGVSYTIYTRIVERGRWCDIVLNVHVTSEEKSDDSRDSYMRTYSRFSIIFLNTKSKV
jgi:hypothetical protein